MWTVGTIIVTISSMTSRANSDPLDLPRKHLEEPWLLPLVVRPLDTTLGGISLSLFPLSFYEELGFSLYTDAAIIHIKSFLDPPWNPNSPIEQVLYNNLELLESGWMVSRPNPTNMPPLLASE